jgi:hypothetical protein
LSAANDGDVTGHAKATQIIVATQIGYNGKDTAASAYKLQWRNVTDAGAFADVGATGECKWAASSGVLADGTALTSGNARCSAPGDQTWQDGLESVNDNVLPDAGTLDLGSDSYTELQWALDLADAHSGDQYEWRLWNNTSGAAVGTCLAQVTILSVSTGTVAGTLAPVASSLAGAVKVAGTAAGTLAPVTGSVEGIVADAQRVGTIAATLAQVTGDGSGAVKVSGAVAGIFASVTASLEGEETVAGAVAATHGPVTASTEGTVAEVPISGTIAADLTLLTADIQGVVALTGEVAGDLALISGAAVGTTAVAGTIDTETSAVTAASEGRVAIAGTVGAGPPFLTGYVIGYSEEVQITGQVAAALTTAMALVSGRALTAAIIAAEIAKVTAVISGNMVIGADISEVLTALAAVMTGEVKIVGVMAGDLAPVTVQAAGSSGESQITGIIDAEVAAIAAEIASSVPVGADITAALTALSVSAQGAVEILIDMPPPQSKAQLVAERLAITKARLSTLRGRTINTDILSTLRRKI